MLKDNRLRSLLQEKLSIETYSRLCERLIKAAEGKLKGEKHMCYDKLKQNKLLFDKKKSVCKMVLNANHRLQVAGWNTLMAFFNDRQNKIRQRMSFIISSLQNQDKAF